jgi:hypothetical protein
MRQSISSVFKTAQIQARSLYLHPFVFMLLCEACMWAWVNDLPFVVTDTRSTPEEDGKLNRVSSTHREGRAFDSSTKGWTKEKIDECMRLFGTKYAAIAAQGSDGKPRLIVHHDTGHGDHLHWQINKKFAVTDINKKEGNA